MKTVWTEAAQADLAEIADYIAADNAPRAASFIHEIVDAGDAIADMPRSFPLVPKLEHKAVRRRIHGRYMIFFRIEGEAVEILHVVHSARDYVRVLFPGE